MAQSDWQPFANPLGYVRLTLLLLWDPIHVFGYSGAMDEYDSYAEGILRLLNTGASDTEIAGHLYGIERDRMEIRPSSAATLTAVVDKLRQGMRAINRLEQMPASESEQQ